MVDIKITFIKLDRDMGYPTRWNIRYANNRVGAFFCSIDSPFVLRYYFGDVGNLCTYVCPDRVVKGDYCGRYSFTRNTPWQK